MVAKNGSFRLFVNLSKRDSRASLEDEYRFTKVVRGSGLFIDGFLEDLREKFSQQGIVCSQTGDVEDERERVGSGSVVGSGQFGGAEVPRADLILSSWNPFNIRCGAKNYSFLGSFNGVVKVVEVAKYSHRHGSKVHEVRDYQLFGDVDFVPYNSLTLSVFAFFVLLSFYLGVGFWLGLLIVVFGPVVFYFLAGKLGDKDMVFAERKVDAAIASLDRYVKEFTS